MKQSMTNAAQDFSRLVVLALCLITVASCGYRVVGSEPVSAGKTRATMAVPPFVNRSMQVGLENIFANDMIRALNNSKAVQVKPGEDKADYVLLGTIKRLEHSSAAYLNIEQSLIRRATLSVEVVLKDTRTSKVIWKDVEIIKSDYVANEYYGVGEATRDQGLRELSARFAQRITDKIGLLF
jgi:Lipopolysaccharide-assembly